MISVDRLLLPSLVKSSILFHTSINKISFDLDPCLTRTLILMRTVVTLVAELMSYLVIAIFFDYDALICTSSSLLIFSMTMSHCRLLGAMGFLYCKILFRAWYFYLQKVLVR